MRRVCLFFMFLCTTYAHAYEAYVSNIGSSSISVIDTTTNAVTATIPLISHPFSIAFTPDGKFAYVTLTSDQVAIIDTGTPQVITNLTVGATPIGIAVTPDGKKVFVANSGSTSISVIDTATNNVTTISLPSSSLPTNIVITEEGKAYVTDVNGNVFVIDVKTESLSATIPIPGLFPFGIGITPYGMITVATFGTTTNPGDILFIDPNTDTISSTKISGVISGRPDQFIFVPIPPPTTTTFAYVTDNESSTLFRFDWSKQVAAPPNLVLSSGSATRGGAISPDGASFYVSLSPASGTDDTVAILNAKKNKDTKNTITVGNFPLLIAFRPIPAPPPAPPPGPTPPGPSPVIATLNLSVNQNKNDFAVIYELYDRLQWTLISNTPAAGFRIYRDDILIATVDGSTFSYEDHNRQKNVTNTYLITAFDANGIDIISSSEVLIK